MQQSTHSDSIPDSYPPCLRQSIQESSNQILNNVADDYSDDDQNHPNEENNDDDPLPAIDLRRIDLQKLNEACTEWGIFRLVNHGVPASLLSELHEHAIRVFDLGFESKQALFEPIPTSVLSYFWGTAALTAGGAAVYKAAAGEDELPALNHFNWLEGFNAALGQLSQVPLDEDPLLGTLRVLLEEYGVHQARIARSIFDAMSQSLKLRSSEEENKSCLSLSTGLLRVYRYPRCFSVNQEKVWGLNAHTDSSVVTILNQFEVGGLQILSEKDNAWIDAKPVPNTLLVHVGDMMQAMSDDKYKSVKHRVKVNREKDRISIGYFVFPGHDCMIRSSTYKPFTYSDFRAQVQHDIKTLGYKVGLLRFKLL